MSKINVQNIEIGYQVVDDQDYICLTDMAKQKDGRIEIIIQNWMRNRMTIEFLGLWEKINNSNFNHIEFDVFRSKAGLNSFYLTPTQWMEKTNAIGIITKKVVMVELMHIEILHLNLQVGYLLNLNYI